MRKLAVLLGFIGQCWTLQEGSWRKRVGVEPTKDRLTAPAGFEVRPPHRGRFSSNELGTALAGINITQKAASDATSSYNLPRLVFLRRRE